MKDKHLLLGLATPEKHNQIKPPPLKVKTNKKPEQQTPNNPPKNHHNQKNDASFKLGCLLSNSDLGSVYGKYNKYKLYLHISLEIIRSKLHIETDVPKLILVCNGN